MSKIKNVNFVSKYHSRGTKQISRSREEIDDSRKTRKILFEELRSYRNMLGRVGA